MAVLSEADRRAAWADFMREESDARQSMSLTKADLRAAFDAIDSWVDGQAATINAAIPQPARTALTTRQKAKLMAMVLQKRYGVSA